MKKERLQIKNIPSIFWGEKSSKLFIAVHGNMSNKEDTVIKIFAEELEKAGYQLLSFDLPEHGDRKEDKRYLCKVHNCVRDLKEIINYIKNSYEEINIWACSMGAYFSLLAFKDEEIKRCIFLSPVVNMKIIIENMMQWANVSCEKLMEKQEIKTDFGQTLYWDYYKYVSDNPISSWNKDTSILYGTKDNMQSRDIIEKFTSDFNCKLSILEDGEHYFHTDEELKFYKEWLKEILI